MFVADALDRFGEQVRDGNNPNIFGIFHFFSSHQRIGDYQ